MGAQRPGLCREVPPDEEDPAGLVRRYRDALAPGSHIILSHAAAEEQRNLDVSTAYRGANAPFIARTRDQVTALLDGMDLVEPGVVHERNTPERGNPTSSAPLVLSSVSDGLCR